MLKVFAQRNLNESIGNVELMHCVNFCPVPRSSAAIFAHETSDDADRLRSEQLSYELMECRRALDV